MTASLPAPGLEPPQFVTGLQGVELLTTGRITLPVPEPHRRWVDGWPHRSYLDFWASLR